MGIPPEWTKLLKLSDDSKEDSSLTVCDRLNCICFPSRLIWSKTQPKLHESVLRPIVPFSGLQICSGDMYRNVPRKCLASSALVDFHMSRVIVITNLYRHVSYSMFVVTQKQIFWLDIAMNNTSCTMGHLFQVVQETKPIEKLKCIGHNMNCRKWFRAIRQLIIQVPTYKKQIDID